MTNILAMEIANRLHQLLKYDLDLILVSFVLLVDEGEQVSSFEQAKYKQQITQ
jgi:hypothetical protein